jgi:sugar phosphate isomerase/epimerase
MHEKPDREIDLEKNTVPLIPCSRSREPAANLHCTHFAERPQRKCKSLAVMGGAPRRRYNRQRSRSRNTSQLSREKLTAVPAVKIAVQLASLRLPLRKALIAAAQMGASAVEIDARGEVRPHELSGTALRELRRLLDDHNLRVSAVGFQTRRGYDVPDELDRRVTATKAAMKMAADLRAPLVVNQVGTVPREPSGRSWETLVQALSDLSVYGQHAGALLAAQTGTESGADLARLIAALPEGGIGADLDPGNLIVNGFSPLEAVETLGPHILHVHATDAVRDLARGRGLEVPLGRGTADFAALLGALEDRQYRGYFTIARRDCENPEFEIAEAVKYLKNL